MNEVFNTLGSEGFGAYEVDWAASSFTRVNKPPKGLLIPGFVDIHIHGAFGIDFMSCSAEEVVVLCDKLAKKGYEAFLPTTVTASPEAVLAAIDKLPSHPMIKGFHLEGPFISDKYPGAQPQEYIVPPPITMSDWDPVLEDARLRLITLAPELPHALELTTRLMSRGVIVSMGHTNATYEEARRGFEFGAAHTTHTFNAMRPFHHREAGLVGYALENHALSTELIYDRLHVVRESAALLVKCKPIDRIIAVSDGTMAAGMPAGQVVEMWGLKCIVGKGQVRLEDGTLAGSGITLLDAFRNLYEDFGPELAIHACSLNPRKALKMLGPPEVYVELDKSLEIVRLHHRRPA